MTRLAASVICYTARPKGLASVIESVGRQKLAADGSESAPWEFVLIDAFWHEREELVADLWMKTGAEAVLVHRPPLPPIDRGFFHSWDIPLYQHSGWAWARGEVILHIEDACWVKEDHWLQTHVEFTREHRNLAAIGDTFSPDGFSLYAQKPAHETLVEWMRAYPNLRLVYDNPETLHCVNANAAGFWRTGNTSLWLEHVINAGPFQERPTHWPEHENMPQLFKYGISMWPFAHAPRVYHGSHSGGAPNHIAIARDAYGNGVYVPVKHEPFESIPRDFPLAMRNLRAERERLGRWVP